MSRKRDPPTEPDDDGDCAACRGREQPDDDDVLQVFDVHQNDTRATIKMAVCAHCRECVRCELPIPDGEAYDADPSFCLRRRLGCLDCYPPCAACNVHHRPGPSVQPVTSPRLCFRACVFCLGTEDVRTHKEALVAICSKCVRKRRTGSFEVFYNSEETVHVDVFPDWSKCAHLYA